MANAVIMTIVCIFAVYGAVRFVILLSSRLLKGGEAKKITPHTVLLLHNSEEDAEAQVRFLVWESALHGSESRDIIAVDMGSSDNTMPILRRLEREYDTVHAMRAEEYIKFIKEH